MSYVSTSILHRSLNDAEEAEFRQWARDNDPPRMSAWYAYHPVCRQEWLARGIRPSGGDEAEPVEGRSAPVEGHSDASSQANGTDA
jgi:hypothetical protein